MVFTSALHWDDAAVGAPLGFENSTCFAWHFFLLLLM
jgi:hypothetical protein